MNFIRVDRWIFALLIGIVGLFFLPLLAGWERFFYDDIAFGFYPQQVFLARCLGEGAIPWWNPHLCAGASPFYAHIFQSSLSPGNWPFLLLGLLDPTRDYIWLIRLPLTCSYLLAAGFAYWFSRRGLRLNSRGSLVFAIAYTFSPFMIYLSTCPPEVYIQAWLPFFCLCLIEFSRRGRWIWLILGSAAFAIASPAGDVPVVSQVIFIFSLFGTGLVIAALAGGWWRQALRVIGGGIVIFGVGALLAGIYWSNMLDGLWMLSTDLSDIVGNLSGPAQSLHPSYLVTLFVPDFFGGVTSHHSWGAAFQIGLSLNDANLLGGVITVFLAVAGSWLIFSKRGRGEREVYSQPSLWWIFFGILIFGLLVVLGGYTPAHGFFRKFIPVLQMPYPVRFRFIECFALAGMLGLASHRLFHQRLKRPGLVLAIYGIGVFGAVLLAFFWPYADRQTLFSPGFKHLTHLRDWEWFIRRPVAYLLGGGLILAGLTFFRRGCYLGPGLVLVAVAEIIFFAYPAFYHNKILNRRNWDFYAERYPGPDSHPEYQKFFDWIPESDLDAGRFRRLYYRSYYDNLVWLNGELSIMGFDIKPLDGRFQGALEELTDGFPYEVRVRRWDSRFWPNMSVRYLFSDRPLSRPGLVTGGRIGESYIYEDQTALNRFFVLDRVVECTEREARAELMSGDLRRGVFIEDSKQLSVISNQLDHQTASRFPLTAYRSFDPGSEAQYLAHFAELQATSPITRLDLSNPNRVEIEFEIERSAMLVTTDLWHPGWQAEMDGETIPIYRVNYLQRGVWSSPGRHRIRMEFVPPTLRRGWIFTGAGTLFFLGLIGLAFSQRRRDKFQGDDER